VAGLVMVISVWLAFSYTAGKQVILYKSSAWALYETLRNDGWVTDDYFPVVTKDLYEHLLAAGDIPPPQGTILGFDHDLPPSVYVTLSLRWIKDHPLQALSQMLKRVYRMWFYIETYPGRWHSGTVGQQLFLHRCLLVFTLMGIPLSLAVWNQVWVFYLIFFYVVSAFITTIGLPRYAITAMPFALLLASHALTFAGNAIRHEGRRLLCSGYGIPLSAAIIILAAAGYLNLATLLSLFPSATPAFCHTMTIILMNLLCIAAAVWAYLLFNLHWKGRIRSLSAAVFPLFVVALFYNNDALSSKTWHEWEIPLRDDQQKIRQTIVLPHDLSADRYAKAKIMIDMFGGGGNGYDFEVAVNGRVIKVYRGGIRAETGKFDQKFYGLYNSFFFDTYGLSPDDLRQWYEIELPLNLLLEKSELVIECSIRDIIPHGNSRVLIFGDYADDIGENFFEGPCFPRSDLDTSLIKIMPYSGDHRFEGITRLESLKTISEYFDGARWQHNDLSPKRGIQSGNYRIRVELTGSDGSQVIL
jgi:hypothetical protein